MSGRITGLALTWLCLPALAGAASPFDADTILEVRLQGPLGTLIGKKWDRENYPFHLEVDGYDLEVDVRVRGNSRVRLCSFPPLRLDFARSDTANTQFAGQGALKLVTHCKRHNARAEGNVLDEFTAYRIFNVITSSGYRVRLLRVVYVDTDGKQKGLDRPYYAFLIESDEELAARLGGEIARIEAVRYSTLDEHHTALMYVFQYLIGNTDYSLARSIGATYCCHNVDLFDVDGRVVGVPYDFDFSGLVNATYAVTDPKFRQRSVRQRRYIGYCLSPESAVANALAEIMAMQGDILDMVAGIPALDSRIGASRINFLERFFKESEDQDRLVKQFGHDCIGHR